MGKDRKTSPTSIHASTGARYEAVRCVKCERCFEPRRHDQRFCSKECRITYHVGVREAGKAAIARKRRGMHYAKVEDSPRLQRVLAVLAEGNWHSTFNLNMNACVTSAGTAIAELKRNGYVIERQRIEGSQSFEYRLLPHEGRKTGEAHDGGRGVNPRPPHPDSPRCSTQGITGRQ